jgi:CHAD domain-containing protein
MSEGLAPLLPSDTFSHAARVAMRPQVERMRSIEPQLHDPAAVEELKRYRVATRRLRAALRVFDGALPKRGVKDVTPELAELARAVGRVRDLDVRIGALPADDALQPLREAWEAERADAAAEMEHRLGTRRHARLVDDLAKLVADGDPDEAPKRGGFPVRDRAGSAAWAAFERLRAATDDLASADLEALHGLRILAKRLRYTLEFLGPVLGPECGELVEKLVALQDHLGSLHDADLARAAARSFLDGDPADVTAAQRTAIEAYADRQADAVDGLQRELPTAAAPIMAAAFAKRLSRAILGPAVATRP